jgi:hypothetical protein
MAGSPIFAATDGLVVFAGWKGAYGNTVEIKANDTLTTSYHHMSQVKATVGANVSAGTVIGYIGSTGNSTGPHLHFEVRIKGKAVDPEPYLSGASTVEQASADATQVGLMDFPSQINKAFETLTDTTIWERVGLVLLGAILLLMAFLGIAKTKALGSTAVGAIKKVGKVRG